MADEREQQEEAPSASTEERTEREPSPWRALWVLSDGQPAWLRNSVAAMDAAAQAEMGHT